jgi:hypothetical protein
VFHVEGQLESAARFKGADLRVLSRTQVGCLFQHTSRSVASTDLTSQPVLLTGKAASGKSAFTKQFVYNTAQLSLHKGNIRWLPLMK